MTILKQRGLQSLSRKLRDDRGSAVVEFVVLTIPLFVPFALYLGFVHAQSQSAFDAHNLARQVARAYITSPTEESTAARVQTVVETFSREILSKRGITSLPEVRITCSAQPCLTPGSQVRAEVTLEDPSIKPGGYLRFIDSTSTKVIASDTQVVDIWRST